MLVESSSLIYFFSFLFIQGLGKTIQSLCFLDQLYRMPTTNVPGPFLVVAPLSLVNQWQSECRTWAPDFNVILYHGSSNARNYLFQQEFYFSEPFVTQAVAMKLKRQHITKFNILITTYEVIMKDLAIFTKIRCVCIRESIISVPKILSNIFSY